jgi:hypothetical protein
MYTLLKIIQLHPVAEMWGTGPSSEAIENWSPANVAHLGLAILALAALLNLIERIIVSIKVRGILPVPITHSPSPRRRRPRSPLFLLSLDP